MIDIQELKNEITDTIKSNGRGEITAEKEQRILLKVADAIAERASQAIVNSLSETMEDLQSELDDCITESELGEKNFCHKAEVENVISEILSNEEVIAAALIQINSRLLLLEESAK